MAAPVKRIDAAGLKAALHDGGEIALLDAREEVPFDARHLLMAACVPLSRLELLVDACVPRRSTRVVWCDDGEGLAERAAAAHGVARLHGRFGACRRDRGLGGGGVPSLQRRPRAEQGVRRGRRARGGHALDHGRATEGADRLQGRYRPVRQPVLRGIPRQQHPDRDQRAGRGARLSVRRPGALARDDGGRELRRPHTQHHRRAVADQCRRAEQGRFAEERHPGLAPLRLPGPERLDRSTACGFAGRSRGGTGDGGPGRRTIRNRADRRRHAGPVAGGLGNAHAVRVRCPHAGGVCGGAYSRHEERARRPAGAGNRPACRDLGRARGAGGRRWRARGDDRALDEADGLGRRRHDRRHAGGGTADRRLDAARPRARRRDDSDA